MEPATQTFDEKGIEVLIIPPDDPDEPPFLRVSVAGGINVLQGEMTVGNLLELYGTTDGVATSCAVFGAVRETAQEYNDGNGIHQLDQAMRAAQATR